MLSNKKLSQSDPAPERRSADRPTGPRGSGAVRRGVIPPKVTVGLWAPCRDGLEPAWIAGCKPEAALDAILHREGYLTTGPRPAVRVFGGWDFTPEDLERPWAEWVNDGYARGVGMGGFLSQAPAGKAPTFMIRASCDPRSFYLDTIRVWKVCQGAKTIERLEFFEVAWSGDRRPNPETGTLPPVASLEDLRNKTLTNTIGAPSLSGFWRDPDFDPSRCVTYSAQVCEIPRPGRSAEEVKLPRCGVGAEEDDPLVIHSAMAAQIVYVPHD